MFLQSCDRRTRTAAIPGSDAYIQNSNSSSSFAALNHIYGSSHERLINLSWLTVNPTVPPSQCSSFCMTVSDSESLIAVTAAAGSSLSPVVIINIENQFVTVVGFSDRVASADTRARAEYYLHRAKSRLYLSDSSYKSVWTFQFQALRA